jgi:hypothetical protein
MRVGFILGDMYRKDSLMKLAEANPESNHWVDIQSSGFELACQIQKIDC